MSWEEINERAAEMACERHNARVRQALKDSRDCARAYRKSGDGRFGPSGRHTGSMNQVLMTNAILHEGHEVMSREGQASYMEDMKRDPEYREFLDIHPDQCVPTGMRNRHGRVKSRTIYHTDGTRTHIEEP